ncbi:hypothetical protein Tco_0809363, partial [Tanacetum coccineum]
MDTGSRTTTHKRKLILLGLAVTNVGLKPRSTSGIRAFALRKFDLDARECRASRNKDGQFRNQDNTRKHRNNEDTSSKAMLAIDGVGFDWSDMAEEQVQTSMALMAFSDSELDLSYSGLDEFKKPEFKAYGSEDSKQESNIVCDKKSNDSKENFDDSLVKEQVSKDTSSFVESSLNVDKETVFPVDKKVEFVKPKNHEKPVKKSVRYAEMYRSQTPKGNPRNWNGQKSNQLGSDFVMYNKACFIFGSFDHVQAHCKYHQRERVDAIGFVNSGCSRHMTGNIACLSDFKEFDGGYVTFRGGAHGGRISGKGTLKTDSLDFEDVVNELKFNFFRVSRMCDKKNYVYFTDTECLVLSPNFKLPDESQILL